MARLLFYFSLLLLLPACTRALAKNGGDEVLQQLQQAAAGDYSSALQATVREGYPDENLHLRGIWTDRYPGQYLYAETINTAAPNQPASQQVFRLERKSKRKFLLRLYELPNAETYAGAYRKPDRLAGLQPANLIEQEGCAIYLKLGKDGTYRGETKPKTCLNDRDGAAYSVTRVNLAGDFVYLWERGFSAAGEEVWGLADGGKMFLREE